MSVYQAALDGEDALKALLKSKVSVNNNDMDGNTALHYVSSYGKVEAVEVLLKNGAKVNLQNNRGDTPLHRASSKGHKQVVSLLLGRGASADKRNNDGQTALQIARRMKHKKVVKLLKAVNLEGATRSGFGFIADTITGIFAPKASQTRATVAPAIGVSSEHGAVASRESTPSNSRAATPDGGPGRRSVSPSKLTRSASASPGHGAGGVSEAVMGMLPSFLQVILAPGGSEDPSVADEQSVMSFDPAANYDSLSLSTEAQGIRDNQHVSARGKDRGSSVDLESMNGGDSISQVSGPDDVVAFTDLPPETDVFDAAGSATVPATDADPVASGDQSREGASSLVDQSQKPNQVAKKGVGVKDRGVVFVADTPGVPGGGSISGGASLASESSDEIHHGAANMLSMKGISLKGEADAGSEDPSEGNVRPLCRVVLLWCVVLSLLFSCSWL